MQPSAFRETQFELWQLAKAMSALSVAFSEVRTLPALTPEEIGALFGALAAAVERTHDKFAAALETRAA